MKKLITLAICVAVFLAYLATDARLSNARAVRYQAISGIDIPEQRGVYPLEINGMECIYIRGTSNAAMSCNWEDDK